MLDFAALPPEINSARMYAGPGSGPMLAASAVWESLADDLYLTAAAYGSAIVDLTSTWLGPSSVSMAGSATTYVSWISATAMQAAETAAQAMTAVAAYEAAFGMTVPPVVIAANRALLLALVATNFFGQNTPAIMATEAEYVEMWIQDAVAMVGYAGASSAASTLAPFTPPADTTTTSPSSSGLGGLAAAVTQAVGTSAGTGVQTVSSLSSAAMPSALQALASTVTSSSSSISPLSSLTTATSAAATSGTTMVSSSSAVVTSGTTLASSTASSASMVTSAVSTLGSSGSMAPSVSPATSAFGGGFQIFNSSLDIGVSPGAGAWGSPQFGDVTVTAASGRAASLGALSVPPGWSSAAPAFSQVPSALPAGSGVPATAPPVVPGGQGAPFGAPQSKIAGRQGDSAAETARYRFRPAVVQRPVYTG